MKKLTQIAGIAGAGIFLLGLFVGLAQQRMSGVALAHGVAGLALMTLGILANLREIKEALAKRSVKMGPQVLIQAVLILAILMLLNVIVYRHDFISDMTRLNLYRLSRVTEHVVAGLPGEVEIMAFYPGGGPSELRQRLQLYDVEFDKVKVTFVDPDKNEDIARSEGVPPTPGMKFKYGKDSVWITKYEENDITNALIKVTRKTRPVVWFTTGHAEPSLKTEGQNGLSYLNQMLTQQGYEAKMVDLSTIEKIPPEVSMVAVVGPAGHFTDHEIAVLDYFAGSGGNMIIALDPVWDMRAISGMEHFLTAFGVKVDWDIVFEPEAHLAEDQQGVWLVVTDFMNNPITSEVTQPRAVLYLARSMEITAGDNSGILVSPLLKSSEESYDKNVDFQAFTSLSTEEKQKEFINNLFAKGPIEEYKKGPFTLAVALQKSIVKQGWKGRVSGAGKPKETRIVVFGTSTVMRNGIIQAPFNNEIVMNAFNWLAGEVDLKNIRSPQRAGTRLSIDESQSDMILYVSVMILPEIFMIVGLAIWWRKR